jgi:hypothetical protein
MPAGHIISTLAWDAYPGEHSGVRRPLPPSQFMGPAVAASRSVHMPYGFAEFGMSSERTQPGWLDQVGAYLMKSGAVFGTLFDSPNVRPSYVVTNPSNIAVWRRWVQASLRANGIGAPPPPVGHHHQHAGAGPAVSGLVVAGGGGLKPGGGRYVTIGFRVSQATDVTVLVLNGRGAVTRTIAQPHQAAGQVSVRYYGYDNRGRQLQPGRYRILVVASNSGGSATAETSLRIR